MSFLKFFGGSCVDTKGGGGGGGSLKGVCIGGGGVFVVHQVNGFGDRHVCNCTRCFDS